MRIDEHSRAALPAAVAEQLIGMIFRNSKRVIVPILISSVLICVLLHHEVGAPLLGGWFALSVAATAARALLLGRLVRSSGASPARKLAATAALSLMTGSAYGSVLLFFPSVGAFERAMLTALLISFCSGAVLANAGYRPIFFAFVLPILGTLALLWAVNPGAPVGDVVARFIAVALLVMLVVLAAIAQDTFDAFSISAQWSDRQERLAAELAASLAETEAARAEAETSSQSKTRFLAAASHDLRQPVHALSLYGATLASAEMSDRARAIVERMNAAVVSLSSQLSGLLDLSRLDSGDIEPSVGTVDLSGVLRALTAELGPVAQAQGVDLFDDVEGALFVHTDPEMLLRILRNLCGNALKYTAEGSVTLRARGTDDVVELSIEDTGIGIAESDRPHIFEEFYQAANTGRDPGMGLGLGLSIVQRLADTLHHEIDVESTHGQGTTVSLRMRRCAAAERPAAPPPARAAPSRATRLPPGLWVHVVDDDASIREGMRALLLEHGCRVTATASTADTDTFLERNAPSVLLVDMRLGGEASGLEVVASAERRRPGLPVALITGEMPDGRSPEGRADGVPVLRKPLTEAALIDAILDLIERCPTAA